MTKRLWAAAAAAIVSAAGGAWLLTARPAAMDAVPSRPAVPTAAERQRLQAQADAACGCGRRKSSPWDKDCWAPFERSLARYEHTESATLCGDLSVGLVCFGPADEACIFRQRQFNACSDEEAAERRRAHDLARRGCTG